MIIRLSTPLMGFYLNDQGGDSDTQFLSTPLMGFSSSPGAPACGRPSFNSLNGIHKKLYHTNSSDEELSTPLMGFERLENLREVITWVLSTPLMGFENRHPPAQDRTHLAFNSLNGIHIHTRCWAKRNDIFQLP